MQRLGVCRSPLLGFPDSQNMEMDLGHTDSGRNRDSLLRKKSTLQNGSEPELGKGQKLSGSWLGRQGCVYCIAVMCTSYCRDVCTTLQGHVHHTAGTCAPHSMLSQLSVLLGFPAFPFIHSYTSLDPDSAIKTHTACGDVCHGQEPHV